ncbi:MAG: hypothetical protein P9L93_06240 [Candidatus Gorgyraea atricola]|nr:hypothetical protein [Candidatus Gorgyraea atricola]
MTLFKKKYNSGIKGALSTFVVLFLLAGSLRADDFLRVRIDDSTHTRIREMCGMYYSLESTVTTQVALMEIGKIEQIGRQTIPFYESKYQKPLFVTTMVARDFINDGRAVGGYKNRDKSIKGLSFVLVATDLAVSEVIGFELNPKIRVGPKGELHAKVKLGHDLHIEPNENILNALAEYKKIIRDEFKSTSKIELFFKTKNMKKTEKFNIYQALAKVIKKGDEIEIFLKPSTDIPDYVTLFVMKNLIKVFESEDYALGTSGKGIKDSASELKQMIWYFKKFNFKSQHELLSILSIREFAKGLLEKDLPELKKAYVEYFEHYSNNTKDVKTKEEDFRIKYRIAREKILSFFGNHKFNIDNDAECYLNESLKFPLHVIGLYLANLPRKWGFKKNRLTKSIKEKFEDIKEGIKEFEINLSILSTIENIPVGLDNYKDFLAHCRSAQVNM